MNIVKFKKELKDMPDYQLRKLMNLAELEDEEKLLVKYAIIDENYVENTCMKLYMHRATYFRKLLIVLVKLYYTRKFN